MMSFQGQVKISVRCPKVPDPALFVSRTETQGAAKWVKF